MSQQKYTVPTVVNPGMYCGLCLYGHRLEVPAVVTIDGCSMCRMHGDAVLEEYHNIYFWTDGRFCFPATIQAIRKGVPA